MQLRDRLQRRNLSLLYAHRKMGRIMLYCCLSVCPSIRLSEDTSFLHDNSKSFTAINFILGI